MISIVCVFNDPSVLNDYLLGSLEKQTADHELIVLDNTSGGFASAAQALNSGARRAKGRYILFAHQDVRLCSPDWLEAAETALERIPNVGIAGVAGMSENGRNNEERRRNVILEHENPVTRWGNPITRPEVVQTVDECLAIVPKHVFDAYQFDEKTCNDWHHFTVDFSLTVKSQGLGVIVLPLLIHHRSLGFSRTLVLSLGSIREIRRYYRSVGKILTKHKSQFEWIYTTNGDYATSKNPIYQDLKRLPSIVASQSSLGRESQSVH